LDIDRNLLKINCDSMSAIYLAKNQVYHVRTKHTDIIFYFVWEILDDGDIELKKIHMKENIMDILTKVVSGVKFEHCKKLLNIPPVACLGGARLMNYGWLDPLGRGT